jgi:hypothetical protein
VSNWLRKLPALQSLCASLPFAQASPTMHLIYLDESGQTGTNLRDTVQPVFVLGALIVPESVWLALEKDLQAAIEKSFPAPRPEDFEIHATEISNPRNG